MSASAGVAASRRARRRRSRFCFRETRASRSRCLPAKNHVSRSACIGGVASRADSFSATRRCSWKSNSSGRAFRIDCSTCWARCRMASSSTMPASISASSVPKLPAAIAGAFMAASLASAPLRRWRRDSIGDTSGSEEFRRSTASRRFTSTRATCERSRPLASS